MPNFPSINTLKEKTKITGEEVIQISATEKATLGNIVNQLLGNTNFGEHDGVGTYGDRSIKPANGDSVPEAILKVFTRFGGDKLQLVTVKNTNPTIVGYCENQYAFAIEFSERYIMVYTIDPKEVDEFETVPEDLFLQIKDFGKSVKYSLEVMRSAGTGDSIYLSPGELVYSTGNNLKYIDLPYSSWGGESQPQLFTCATLVSEKNITKSMFESGNDDNKFFFMDGFDNNPGTALQCVTFQLFTRVGIMNYILVNKCGYN